MAIQAIDNEVELVVTWVCNWHCEYCCVDTHNRPKLAFEAVKAKIELIPDGCFVTLSGGEVGSMKRAEIEYILDRLDEKHCDIGLNTNGLFIKRYYDLLPRFAQLLYHCSENLDEDDEIIIDPLLDLQYLLIVTDNNYPKLRKFLDKYPNIQFHLVAATNPLGMTGPTLSTKLKHKMMVEFHRRMSDESKRRVFNEKKFNEITYI